MPSNQDRHDVGLVYATNLYPRSQLFEVHKVYTLKQLFNSDLNQTICALMDGDTYGGSLTAAGAATVARLFQPGHTVKIRVTRVGDTKGETWSPRLKRFQAWTHGRGEVWQEKDEPDKDEDAGKASSGFDGSSAPKSVAADDNSSSGRSSTE